MIARARQAFHALLPAGGIGRSIATVGGATVFAQLVALAVSPILSRIYDAKAFGLFGLFFNFVTVTGVVATIGLHEAVLAARKRTDALALLGAGLFACSAATLVLALAAFGLIRMGLFGLGILPPWAAVMVIPSLWLISTSMMLQLWVIRARRFRGLAAASAGQGVGRAGVQLGAGLAVPALGWVGLFFGEIAGRTLTVVALASQVWPDIRVALRLSPRRWWQAVARYRRFPLLRTPSHFTNNIASTLPLFLVASTFTTASTGQLSFMMALVVGPIGLVQRAVGDIFLGEFAARWRQNREGASLLLVRTTAILAAMAVPGGVVLFLVGRPLFGWVFGANWQDAGSMASFYAPVLVANLVVAPVGGVLPVLDRPGFKLGVDLVAIALQVAGYEAAVRASFGPISVVGAVFAGYALSYVLYLALIFYAVARPGPLARST